LFRDFTIDSMPLDLTITSAGLDGKFVEVGFSDGMTDRFSVGWLLDYAAEPPSPSLNTWRSDHTMQAFDRAEVFAGNERHHRLLEAILSDGVARISGLPDDSDATEHLAALLGHIRETDFGRIFDIVSEPDPFTPSQSTMALDPHTDDPYRYTPSGISILHCMMPSVGGGGESTVVDGFAVAEMIHQSDPEAFELLSTVSVPFEHRRAEAVDQGDDVFLCADAPIISVDPVGNVCGIRWHERSMAPMRIDADLADRFYPALGLFSTAIRSEEFTWRHHLAAGEALVYDNQRVLHGRTGFEGAQTRRHIRLCTVDRDQVHSRLRRLREAHAPGTEHHPFPAGSLS
jgi:alpha-ketoglutarate-dependent taurine dioxygenase